MNRPVTTSVATAPSADDPGVVTRLLGSVRARRRRRADRRRLLAELGEYRTAPERLELEAVFTRGAEREVEAIRHLLHAGRRAA